jgi:TolB-like protein
MPGKLKGVFNRKMVFTHAAQTHSYMLSPDPLAVQSALGRILSSKIFKKSSVLSNFLNYVVTQTIRDNTNAIKEYSIAVNALGKPPDFNPQLDAVIRIHAGRLRRSLLEYYSNEGAGDPIIISLNKGSYIPGFSINKPGQAVKGSKKGAPPSPGVAVNRVAVLPFKNLSGLAENDFIVDGFCEQLTADLSQSTEIAVISSFSTSRFSNEKTDIRSVGKELNASHLITGSIYRDSTHLRVSMQLVNAGDGAQVWTKTYNRALDSSYLYDIFDDIITQVVPLLTGYHGLISRSSSLSTQIEALGHGESIDAVFWFYHYQIRYTEEVFQTARRQIERSLEQNPGNALAWAILAQLYIDGNALSFETVPDSLNQANKFAQKALQLDPDCQHAHVSLAWMQVFNRNKKATTEALEYAEAINPRSTFFLGAACFLYGLIGEYEKSMHYFNQTKILNPYYAWWVNLGPYFTYVARNDFAKASEFASHINIPGSFWNYIFKIAAQSQLVPGKETAELTVKLQEEFPGKTTTASAILRALVFDDAVYERINEGLQKAGLAV